MKLYLATGDLVRDGRSFEGFPLLLKNDFTPEEPAQTFLWHALVETGSVTSPLTWEAYGRWLFDYFEFLEHNGLQWDQAPGPKASNPLSRYRQWALTEVGNSRRTINLYTGLVRRFYLWAHAEGHIDHMPLHYRPTPRPAERGLLAHVKREDEMVSTIKLREHKELPEMLTMEQVRICRQNIDNEGHSLLFELMVQVGLRSCEARTFPTSYAFNPRLRADLTGGRRSVLPVDLDPQDMAIKYDKPRTVHVPWPLMERLNAFVVQQRSGLKERSVTLNESPALILSTRGEPFGKDSIVDVCKGIEKRVGFRVRAHMLRHTYATYVLRALRRSKDFEGEPLLYVRDRLGHSDVQTTAIYLHLITQLEAEMVLAHEDYIDDLFDRAEP